MINLRCFILLLLVSASQLIAIETASDSQFKKANLLPVPIVRQSTSYSCGAASLLSVLYYWKSFNEAELSLHEPLKTDKEFGTHPFAILKLSQSLGLKSELKTQLELNELEAAISKKEPVIVDYQAWGEPENNDYSNVWDSGHYSVVIGFDERYLYFMDPMLSSSYGRLEKIEFMKRWHDMETRDGKSHRFINMAIFFTGTQKLKKFPSEPSTIN
jgi:predicted double-glycine peptidase